MCTYEFLFCRLVYCSSSKVFALFKMKWFLKSSSLILIWCYFKMYWEYDTLLTSNSMLPRTLISLLFLKTVLWFIIFTVIKLTSDFFHFCLRLSSLFLCLASLDVHDVNDSGTFLFFTLFSKWNVLTISPGSYATWTGFHNPGYILQFIWGGLMLQIQTLTSFPLGFNRLLLPFTVLRHT